MDINEYFLGFQKSIVLTEGQMDEIKSHVANLLSIVEQKNKEIVELEVKLKIYRDTALSGYEPTEKMTDVALLQLWEMLGVSNQTQAVMKLKEIKNAINQTTR